MRQHIIALVDCDCFYVSCERKDNPDLQGKPVCVMTGGGDKGIIVSRAKEAIRLHKTRQKHRHQIIIKNVKQSSQSAQRGV